ncbi:MAG: peptidase U32 family protein [Akkermansia sp.]
MSYSSPVEIMAPAGSFESLSAALLGGANSVYFGVGVLNMRSRATVNFSESDLVAIVARCREFGAKAYLTLNIIVYDEELEAVHQLCDAALNAGIDAVIASDIAVIRYAHSIGLPVHISVQANVCNIETVRFYAQYAEVVVLARELKLGQIRRIIDSIRDEEIRGSKGELMRVEVFAHGALCVAVSGKCLMSLAAYNSSANRGACFQNCRRAYRVTDEETGYEMVIDNKYVMSPKDICTIGILDQLLEAGVSVLKLEGRGRSSHYVQTVTSVYREAASACLDGSYSASRVEGWLTRLSSVFNRGFWQGGYYLGTEWDTWSGSSSNKATLHKVHIGKVVNWFSKSGIAGISLEAGGFTCGDRLLITGATTGAIELVPDAMKKEMPDGEMLDVSLAGKGDTIYLAVSAKVRRNDKVYLMRPRSLDD